jgi:hypothetical protein
MKAEPGDKRLGCHHLDNIQKANLIKREMLRIHDEIKAQNIYPTLRKILRAMPFHVNESWGSELRKELIEEGLIPQPPRGSTNPFPHSVNCNALPPPSLEEIRTRKLEILKEFCDQRASYVGQKSGAEKRREMSGQGETAYQLSPDRMTPRQASEWARTRYKAAWESVQAISRHKRRWPFLAHPETVEVM